MGDTGSILAPHLMPIETSVTRCGNCGANLQPHPASAFLTCEYCEQITWLTPTESTRSVASSPRAAGPQSPDGSVHALLLRGPSQPPHGHAARRTPAEMKGHEAAFVDRAVWPVRAQASSTFGGSWSPSAVLGVPRVFPRCGDIGGAWAPGPSVSEVEWLEVEFSIDSPVNLLRVFETNKPGSTFAVVDFTEGETLLYAGALESRDEASVLEVAITPPRVIRRVRVYVANRGWAEIDTVGLLTAQPLPQAQRVVAPVGTAKKSLSWVVAMLVFGVVSACGAGMVLWGSSRPSASAPLERPSAVLGGASLAYATPLPDALAARGILWASAVREFSSQFSSTRNAATAVLGAPDVYPTHEDLSGAWAPAEKNAGGEWIVVEFSGAPLASAIVWAETFHPGALARVDDLSDPEAPVVLWEGVTASPGDTAVLGELRLPTPRAIRALRFVLDTRRADGWNELDAIGLALAR